MRWRYLKVPHVCWILLIKLERTLHYTAALQDPDAKCKITGDAARFRTRLMHHAWVATLIAFALLQNTIHLPEAPNYQNAHLYCVKAQLSWNNVSTFFVPLLLKGLHVLYQFTFCLTSSPTRGRLILDFSKPKILMIVCSRKNAFLPPHFYHQPFQKSI